MELERLLVDVLEELRAIREAMQAPPKIMLSKKEVAAMLDLSERTVDRLTQKGLLKAIKLGNRTLYNREEVLKAVA